MTGMDTFSPGEIIASPIATSGAGDEDYRDFEQAHGCVPYFNRIVDRTTDL
jgi:hypothetical protein